MGKQRVLIVDDEATIRYALERMMRPLEVETLTAANGEEALAVFRDRQPDLVLLDIVMPVKNGFEVCAELKSDPQTRLTPIVMVTSSSAPEDKVRGIEVGVDDFISKPFDRAELTARVRSLLRLKSYTDELERARWAERRKENRVVLTRPEPVPESGHGQNFFTWDHNLRALLARFHSKLGGKSYATKSS